MMQSRYIALLLALGAAAPVQSQINRPSLQLKQPSAWLSLGAGHGQGWTVANGDQVWDFGGAPQYVASLEKVVASGTSIGIAASTASVPVHITSSAAVADANANVSQAFATLHLASLGRFHTSADFRAGTTIYSFGANALVSGYDADLAYGYGWGVGYSISPRFSLDVVKDVTTSMHQKDGLSAGTGNSARANTTRVIGRFGLGG